MQTDSLAAPVLGAAIIAIQAPFGALWALKGILAIIVGLLLGALIVALANRFLGKKG